MDALSQLLILGRMNVHVDLHCLLSGTYTVPHDQLVGGEAPFHLVLSGECRVRTAAGWIELKTGDFLLLPHGDPHDVVSTGFARSKERRPVRTLRSTKAVTLPIKGNVGKAAEADLDLLCGRFVSIHGAGFMLLRTLPAVVHVNLQRAEGGELLAALIALLRQEATLPRAGALAVVNALGQAILTLALRHHGVNEDAPPGLLTVMADRRLGPSIRAMLLDLSQDWTIASLGRKTSMSRATYARHFRRKAGMPVGEFLLTLRMMQACDLMQHTDRGLAEIGQTVGYESEAAFGKAFRHLVGQTPGRWRRMQRAL